jgi:hypothetical protein
MPLNSTTARIVHLNLDFVIAAMEARPATRTRGKAWGWLAEQSTVTFDGAALVVPSATWSNTRYLATPDTCTCPARGHCHHKESAAIVADALAAENAMYDQLAERDAMVLPFDLGADLVAYPPVAPVAPSSGYKAALADLLECFN